MKASSFEMPAVNPEPISSRMAQLDQEALNAVRDTLADYFIDPGYEPTKIAEFSGYYYKKDPQKSDRLVDGLMSAVPGFDAAFAEAHLGMVPWQSVDDTTQQERYLPVVHTRGGQVRNYWLVERRTLNEAGHNQSYSLHILREPTLELEEPEQKRSDAQPVIFAASVAEVRDGYNGSKDYESVWRDFSPIFKAGTTEYLASVPVVKKLGNRPSLMYEQVENLPKVNVTLSVTLTTKDEPIVLRLEADPTGELLGYPIAKDHDFGQAPGNDEPQFVALEVTMLPGRTPQLIGERLDGVVERMQEGEPVESLGFSGMYGFITPLLIRTRGKLRHTKLGLHTAPNGTQRWVEPNADVNTLAESYFAGS